MMLALSSISEQHVKTFAIALSAPRNEDLMFGRLARGILTAILARKI